MKLTKIETNLKRNLFFHTTSHLSNKELGTDLEKQLILIYPEIKYQEIIGFGGALTGSSAYNFHLLPKEKQESFLSDYFGKDGIGYSFCRTCIGSSDFSPSSYSYLYEDNLASFSIEPDKAYLLPFLKACKKTNPDLTLLASPWSPPAFMKSNQKLIHGREIIRKI